MVGGGASWKLKKAAKKILAQACGSFSWSRQQQTHALQTTSNAAVSPDSHKFPNIICSNNVDSDHNVIANKIFSVKRDESFNRYENSANWDFHCYNFAECHLNNIKKHNQKMSRYEKPLKG